MKVKELIKQLRKCEKGYPNGEVEIAAGICIRPILECYCSGDEDSIVLQSGMYKFEYDAISHLRKNGWYVPECNCHVKDYPNIR